MKKYLLIGAVVVSIVGLVWFSKRSDEVLSEAKEKPNQEAQASQKDSKNISISQLRAEPLEIKQLDKAPAELPATEASCRAFHEELATTSMNLLKDKINKGIFTFPKNCQSVETQDKWVKDFYANCSSQPINQENCNRSLSLYRSKWIDLLTKDQTDYMNMDMKLLVNKYLAQLGEFDGAPRSKELLKMGEALREREPEALSAHKAYIIAMMASSDIKKGPDFNSIHEAAKEALKIDPDDTQLHEAYLISEMDSKNYDSINEFVTAHPNSPPALYFQAAALRKLGDQKSALALAEKANELDPKHPRYAQLMEQFKKDPNSDKVSLTIGMTTNIDND